MGIIEEYKAVYEQVAVLESQLTTAKRELNKLTWGASNELRAIDYSSERVSTSGTLAADEVFSRIIELPVEIQRISAELESWDAQLKRLEEVIKALGDNKKTILMLLIQGRTQHEIAMEMGYSLSWIEKLFRQIRKECGKSAGIDDVI